MILNGPQSTFADIIVIVPQEGLPPALFLVQCKHMKAKLLDYEARAELHKMGYSGPSAAKQVMSSEVHAPKGLTTQKT